MPPSPPSLSLSDRFRTIAENLLHLEVNTIVSDEITAEKMPPPEHALIEIGNGVRDYLGRVFAAKERRELFVTVGAADAAGFGPLLAGVEAGRRTASRDGFDLLRTVIRRLLELDRAFRDAGVALTPEETRRLTRILDNVDQLKGTFDRLSTPAIVLSRDGGARPQPIDPEPEDLVLIHKVWEVGLEDIQLQTVIQLDGDVVTRLRETLAVDGKRLDSLLRIHNQAVATSIGFWNGLVNVLGTLVKGVADLVLPARK